MGFQLNYKVQLMGGELYNSLLNAFVCLRGQKH